MPVVIDTPLPQQENHPITFADMGTKPTKTKRHMKDQPFISPQFQRHLDHFKTCQPCRVDLNDCSVSQLARLEVYAQHAETCSGCRRITSDCMADASTDPEANGVISQGPSGNRGSTYALSKGQAHASGLGKEASSKGNSASAPVVGGGSHETPIVIDEEDDAPDPAPAKPSKSKIAAQLLAKLTTEKDQGVVPNPASAPSKGRAPNPASAPSKGRAPNPAPAPSKGRAPNPAPAPSKAEVEAKPGKGDPLKFADIRVMKKQLTRLRYQFIILIFLQLVNSDMTSGYAFGIGLAMLVLHFA